MLRVTLIVFSVSSGLASAGCSKGSYPETAIFNIPSRQKLKTRLACPG